MITNLARVIIMALVGLMMVPYYIDQFGLATYAILPLATSLTTYVQMASEALSESFARYLTIAIHSGDRKEANIVYSSSVIGMLKLFCILLPIIIVVALISPFVFNIGSAGVTEVQIMFFLVLFSSLLMSFITCLNSVYMAYNYLYVMYIIRIVHTLLQVGLIVGFFFINGPSISFIGWSYLISSLVLVFGLFYGVHRIDPELKVVRSEYDQKRVITMARLGFWGMILRLGEMLFIQASMIVVNITLGSETQAEFSIASNMVSMVFTVCCSIAVIGVPLSYRNFNDGDLKGLCTTLNIFTKFTGLVMLYPLVYLCVFAPQVLQIWLSSSYPNVVTMILIMIPACLSKCVVNILEYVPIIYARIRPIAILTCVVGVANIVASIILVNFTDIGVNGVCLIWSLSILALNVIVYPIITADMIGISRLTFYKPMAINYIVFTILLVAGMCLCTVYTLPATWLAIILSAMLTYAVYLLVIFRFGLNRTEKGVMITYFPQRVRGMMAKIMKTEG